MDFGNWDRELHFYPQQVKRILLALKIPSYSISYTKDKSACYIQGRNSEPYKVTLNDCSCNDFSLRKLPCKHIYCFAYRLGLLNDLPKNNNSKRFDIIEEGERYKNLYKTGVISAEQYIEITEAIDYNNAIENKLIGRNVNGQKPIDKAVKKTTSSLGCCSRYMECSKEGKCICPVESTSSRCMYKQNLEKGLNFYYKDNSHRS